ncbi:flagellar hook-length control protein FliK [Domibacillus mangrovi]|uniref:Flagellar hook-length control protein-like C-terminal domain-containing protein n=1 Tax=Domibacillus mangrovi TaxID=1714354 RepID=A0A1Q5P4F0_9BACI|nr:flagellar hook-length control protein FliK [Domibacillus mangrovi]OKL37135.1 hypothetical protein BLL40_06010 [Domibacillus mangrovi]
MQAIFGSIALPGASIPAEISSNVVQKTSEIGFEQILGTIQQSIQSETILGAVAAEIGPEADFIAVLGALAKPVESLMDIPDMDPKLVEMAEQLLKDGDMPTMQELALILGADVETIMASIQQMASLFANEETMKELPETVPVAQLASTVQLIAANAPQIVKESDKQAAVMLMKAAKIIQKFTGQHQPAEQTSKLLQSALQQATSMLQKETVQMNSTHQITMQTAYAHYNSAAISNQPATQPKVDTVTVRPGLGQDALNPVVHQMTKIEQVAMSVKTAPRPMNMDQFIEKFTRILGHSNLMKTPNGTKLLIKLYPEQLGTLRIELLQQNGVITAKILSSTQAVKELLEQNAHQLKQAFGQQNVNVEKIEIANQEMRQQMFDRNNQQDRQNGQQQQNDQRQANQVTEEESGSFAELLTHIEIEV